MPKNLCDKKEKTCQISSWLHFQTMFGQLVLPDTAAGLLSLRTKISHTHPGSTEAGLYKTPEGFPVNTDNVQYSQNFKHYWNSAE